MHSRDLPVVAAYVFLTVVVWLYPPFRLLWLQVSGCLLQQNIEGSALAKFERKQKVSEKQLFTRWGRSKSLESRRPVIANPHTESLGPLAMTLPSCCLDSECSSLNCASTCLEGRQEALVGWHHLLSHGYFLGSITRCVYFIV